MIHCVLHEAQSVSSIEWCLAFVSATLSNFVKTNSLNFSSFSINYRNETFFAAKKG